MQHTILYLVINIIVFVVSLTTLIVACVHADRTVKEGVRSEAERRRTLTALSFRA